MSEPNLGDLLSGGGLSSLLANPEVLAKLPKMMEALRPMLAQMNATPAANAASAEGAAASASADEAAPASAQAEEAIAQAARAIAPPGKPNRNKIGSHHTALLHALEPYLSEERRQALSYILKVATLIDLVGEVL